MSHKWQGERKDPLLFSSSGILCIFASMGREDIRNERERKGQKGVVGGDADLGRGDAPAWPATV